MHAAIYRTAGGLLALLIAAAATAQQAQQNRLTETVDEGTHEKVGGAALGTVDVVLSGESDGAGVGEKIAEVYWGPAIGGAIENWFAYMLALAFLLVRPQGLFGEKIIERV